jgi:hypothetical protein
MGAGFFGVGDWLAILGKAQGCPPCGIGQKNIARLGG